MADGLEIRPATVDDAEAGAHVHVESWRAAYTGILSDETIAARSKPVRAAQWRSNVSSGHMIVAVRDEVVVGFGGAGAARDDEEAGNGEIYALYVHPDEWGSGAADALIAALERRLRSAGYSEAMLWVLAENPRARRFYERHGWEDDGGRDVYDGDESKTPIARHRKRFSA